jgi:hypothetical protein
MTIPLFSSPSFVNAKANKEVAVFENITFPDVTREEILNAYNTSKMLKPLSTDKTSAWVAHDAEKIIESLSCLQNTISISNHLYYSSNDEKGFGRHRDLNDVLFVQLMGSTNWKIENPYTGDLYDVTLEEKDAVYVPYSFFHTVTNMSEERAGLTISVGDYLDDA